jgi:ubiquinol oxidase
LLAVLDLIKAVRADEAGHRFVLFSFPFSPRTDFLPLPSFVNHTLANLKKDDFNPVAMKHAPPITQGAQPGWSREESLEWARKVQEEMTGRKPEAGEKKEL